MKKIKKLFWLLGFSLSLLVACNSDPETPNPAVTYDHGVLIVNEGNFTSADGEITHYDPETEAITNNLYQNVNGNILAAYIENVRLFGDQVYIVDSKQGGAKVVVVDKRTFAEKGRTEGLEVPRDVTLYGEDLFIADWGDYDENFASPNSFIAVAPKDGGAITEKIEVPSRPESIVTFQGNIFVACQASRELLKIDPQTLVITAQEVMESRPVQLLIQDDKLMLYSTLDEEIHLLEINPNSLESTEKSFDIPNSTRFVFQDNNTVLVLTSTYAPDFSYTDNQVLQVNLSGNGNPNLIYEARNLKGIGYHKELDHIYIADDNGIQGNGTVIIADSSGGEIKKLDVGRVPSRFHFY